MDEWRKDPRYVNDKAHTDRWNWALLAFGDTVSGSSLTPMSVAEAQGYADRGGRAGWRLRRRCGRSRAAGWPRPGGPALSWPGRSTTTREGPADVKRRAREGESRVGPSADCLGAGPGHPCDMEYDPLEWVA